jgi:hypothetical protein
MLWDLNRSSLEIRQLRKHVSVAGAGLIAGSRIAHWIENTTREASVAAAEGKATSFKRACGPGMHHLDAWSPRRTSDPIGTVPSGSRLSGRYPSVESRPDS